MIWTSPAGAKPGATIINTDARTTVLVFHANKQVVVSSHEVAVEVPESNQYLGPLQRARARNVGQDLGRGVTAVQDPSDGDPSWGIISLRKGCVLCATRMSRRTSGLHIYLAARDEQQQMVYHKTQNMIVPLKLIHNSRNFVLQSSVTPKVNKSLTGNCSLFYKQIG